MPEIVFFVVACQEVEIDHQHESRVAERLLNTQENCWRLAMAKFLLMFRLD